MKRVKKSNRRPKAKVDPELAALQVDGGPLRNYEATLLGIRRGQSKKGLELPPTGGESKPRRPHRATGQPRGGKRSGAGRKGIDKQFRRVAARVADGSVRSFERMARVRRYSPLLYAEFKKGLPPYTAERLLRFVITQTSLQKELPDQLRTEPWVLEIQATYRRELATEQGG